MVNTKIQKREREGDILRMNVVVNDDDDKEERKCAKDEKEAFKPRSAMA